MTTHTDVETFETPDQEIGFSNRVIANADGTTIHSPDITHVSADYPGISLLVGLSVVAVLSVVILGLIFQPYFALPEKLEYWGIRIWGGIALLWCLIEAYEYGANKRLGYCLREQDITMFKGWLFCKISTQPICRIQHIEVKQGPIDRKIGLAKLHVFSAGDLTQTFIIPGLEKDKAEFIRNTILQHKELHQRG